jgi:U6 snRNA-associated Sm-like protein LSm7
MPPKEPGKGGGKGDKKQESKNILDLDKYLNKKVRVKFSGGREVTGILKGSDPFSNLVLDQTVEYLRDPDDPYKVTTDSRKIGLMVARGIAVMLVCPEDGMEEIKNPYSS